MKYATKTNNKTLLLALVAVFAMIFAGAAVVALSEDAEVDATAIEPTEKTDYKIDGVTVKAYAVAPTGVDTLATTADNQIFVITGAKNATTTLTITVANEGAVFYVVGVADGEISIVAGGKAFTVISAEEGAEPTILTTIEKLPLQVKTQDLKIGVPATGYFTLTGAAATSAVTITDDATITDLGETFTLGEDVTIAVAKDKTFTFNSANDITAVGIAKIKSAAYYNATLGLMAIYGTQPVAGSLADGDEFMPTADGVTIASEKGTVEINKFNGKAYAGNVILKYDATGEIMTATGNITQGEMKVTFGVLTIKTAYADIGALNFGTNFVITGTVPAVIAADGDIAVDDKIYATLDATNKVALGNFVVIDSNLRIGFDMIVNPLSILTVPEKKTLTIGQNTYAADPGADINVTVNGTLDVWGKIAGVTGKYDGNNIIPKIDGDGTVKIRAGAQITGLVNNEGASTITTTTIKEVAAVEDESAIPTLGGTVESDLSIKNFKVGASLVVPSGVTLTVTGMMDLAGSYITINGTLVIAEGALVGGTNAAPSATVNAIILGSTGKITINGTIAKYNPILIGKDADKSITIQGIIGESISVKKLDGADRAVISGDIQKDATANVATVSLKDAYINADTVIGSGVTATVATASVLNGYVLDIDGLLVQTASLTLKNGSVVTVDGYATGTFTAQTSALVPLEKGSAVAGTTTFELATGSYTTPAVTTHATGYSIGVSQITFVDEITKKDMFYQRAYFFGDVSVLESTTGSTWATDATVTIDGDGPAFVPVLCELKLPKGVGILGNDMLVVEGLVSSYKTVADNVKGAYFSIVANEVETFYATDINTALSGDISSYKEKTVTIEGIAGYEVELAESIVILDGETVAYAASPSLIIPEDTSVLVSKGANFDASSVLELNGKIIVMKDGTCTIAPGLYEVFTENEEGDIVYCGFQTALNEAEAGDTITLVNDYGAVVAYKQSLTVPAGVKVVVESSAKMYISNSLTVSAGAELEVSGSLYFGKADVRNARLNVAGTMDISSSITSVFVNNNEDERYCMQITSTGTFIFRTTQDFDDATAIGVAYIDGTKTVLTTIDQAIEAGATDITIPGDYTSDAAIDLGSSSLTILGTAKFNAITVKGGSIDSELGALTATINAALGTDEVTVIAMKAFNGVIEDKLVSGEYVAEISAYNAGSVDITSGVATLSDANPLVGAKAILNVGESAVLTTKGGVAMELDGIFNVDGALIVAKDTTLDVAVDDDAIFAITGSAIVAAGATFETGELSIVGDVDVFGTVIFNDDVYVVGELYIDDSEDTVATNTIIGNVIVGIPTIGAGGSISGMLLDLGLDNFVVAFPGANIAESCVKDLNKSVFVLNDAEYCTAYAEANDVEAIGDDGVINEIIPIAGYDMSGMYPAAGDKFVNWTNGIGMPITALTNVIGTEMFCFDGAQKTADVLVSVATGMSIYVDGVKYASGTTIEGVSMGAHTVMVTVNPGYKYADGTGPTVTFDGKVLSGILAFTITTDMADKTVVLSAIGDIVVDQPDIPEQEKEDNSMIMILLGVLVVMVVILAIVTVIRMMRS